MKASQTRLAVQWLLVGVVTGLTGTSAFSAISGAWYEMPPELFSRPADQPLLPIVDRIQPSSKNPSSLPAYQQLQGTAFGGNKRRITDNNGGARHGLHQYSRTLIWNADESVIDIGNRLLDANSLAVIVDQVKLSSARHWSYTDPHVMYGVRFSNGVANRFSQYNYTNGSHDDMVVFENHHSCTLGEGEGSISINEKQVLISCQRNNDDSIDLLSVDLSARKIIASRPAEAGYNWASFSQSGEYIVVENQYGNHEELVRYDRSFGNRTVIATQRNHGDMGRDVNGDDVFVMIDWDHISYIRLKDGVTVNLGLTASGKPRAGHGHISCRNIRRPGWCYFSSYGRGMVGAVKIESIEGSSDYHDNEGVLVRDGAVEAEMWGVHNSSSATYQSQPQVTVSPTGSHIVFTSDWQGQAAADSYMISVPMD